MHARRARLTHLWWVHLSVVVCREAIKLAKKISMKLVPPLGTVTQKREGTGHMLYVLLLEFPLWMAKC